MKTVKATELSKFKMVGHNEKIYGTVIDDGIVKDWVGFTWIVIGEATKEDYEKYPVVTRENK